MVFCYPKGSCGLLFSFFLAIKVNSEMCLSVYDKQSGLVPNGVMSLYVLHITTPRAVLWQLHGYKRYWEC